MNKKVSKQKFNDNVKGREISGADNLIRCRFKLAKIQKQSPEMFCGKRSS